MGNESSLVFSGIAPHPPIMVPEVGREAISEVRRSIRAMEQLTQRILAAGAETVILISPHAPLEPDAFVAYDDANLQGGFANFRAPHVELTATLDTELLSAIAERSDKQNYSVAGLAHVPLDHGTAVPLYFLQRNGWRGRLVALGYSFLSNDDHLGFGSCIREAIEAVGRPVALIASGDLSHRLKPEAPGGYEPAAYIFDDEVVDALRANNPDRIARIDPDLRRLAGECGYRSMLIALGATHHSQLACEVLSYEAPFGVGYMVAQLTNKQTGKASSSEKEIVSQNEKDSTAAALTALAREAVEKYVREGSQIKSPSDPIELLNVRAACFVSLKTNSGDLRGCIGTIEPTQKTLAEEIIANAINAATRDPRFSPVAPVELANLRYSVDVLSVPEPAALADLDPELYGVIVEDETGYRRGLLLPALESIETVEQQVAIAARKAGIPPETPVKLSRFSVGRYVEK